MASAYTTSLIKTFLQQHYKDIRNAIVDTGLFFPAVVAQLSVESDNGTSDLATQYNNYGGIKGNSSNGVLYQTREGNNGKVVNAYFRRFNSFADFMNYYVNDLKSQRYIDAGVYDAQTPEDQITAMVQGGYSTMSPSAYLANGIKDRINATRDLMPFGKISSAGGSVYKLTDINTLTSAGIPAEVFGGTAAICCQN